MTKEKCCSYAGPSRLPSAERVVGCYCLIRDLGDLLGRLRERGVTYVPLKAGGYRELIGLGH